MFFCADSFLFFPALSFLLLFLLIKKVRYHPLPAFPPHPDTLQPVPRWLCQAERTPRRNRSRCATVRLPGGGWGFASLVSYAGAFMSCALDNAIKGLYCMTIVFYYLHHVPGSGTVAVAYLDF